MRSLSIGRSRLVLPLAAALISASVALFLPQACNAAAATDAAPGNVPILVELFTSEGCSSCPPADDLLARLDQQPIPGAHMIVLSEHVTYWDRQGWKDPFSLDAMTSRQHDYGDRFHLDDIYTPQAVVDGAAQFTGSDARKMEAAIRQAITQPKVALTISSAQWTGSGVQFSVTGPAAQDANLFAALANDTEQVSVLRGENGGHTLHHVAVVRNLQNFGKAGSESKGPFGKPLTLSVPKAEASSTTPLRLVIFLTDRKSGHVLGVAEQTVARSK